MDNKVQNIILKALTFILIGTGVLMTYWVMNDDNPYPMKPWEHAEWGKKAYNEEFQGKDEKLTPAEASVWIKDKTEELVNEKKQNLDNDVSKVIDYTRVLLFLCIILVLASFVYLITIDYKKALKILAGFVALGLFIYISYITASDEVPMCISAMDGNVEGCQKPIFTSDNWKIASAAISTTLILIIVTVLAWISGSVMKLFR